MTACVHVRTYFPKKGKVSCQLVRAYGIECMFNCTRNGLWEKMVLVSITFHTPPRSISTHRVSDDDNVVSGTVSQSNKYPHKLVETNKQATTRARKTSSNVQSAMNPTNSDMPSLFLHLLRPLGFGSCSLGCCFVPPSNKERGEKKSCSACFPINASTWDVFEFKKRFVRWQKIQHNQQHHSRLYDFLIIASNNW